jgi:hypothetical protein
MEYNTKEKQISLFFTGAVRAANFTCREKGKD